MKILLIVIHLTISIHLLQWTVIFCYHEIQLYMCQNIEATNLAQLAYGKHPLYNLIGKVSIYCQSNHTNKTYFV